MTAHLVGYLVVALLGAAVQLAVLAALSAASTPHLVAFWAGWLVAWAHNWLWLRSVVFRDREGEPGRGLLAALLGLGVQTAVFAGLNEVLPVVPAAAGALVVALPVTFLATRQWAFRRHTVS